MDARQRSQIRTISRKQEKQTATELGGRTQAASGALRLGGGADVRVLGKTRIECKFTDKPSYALKFKELQKLRKQANKTLEYPVFQFAFHHGNNHMAKYAVVAWVIGDRPEETDHSWATSSQQMIFSEPQLNAALNSGRIQLTWLTPGDLPFGLRIFEIMHWDDFLASQKSEEV
jgi:hypothetical protein